jgi:hypothetical protein
MRSVTSRCRSTLPNKSGSQFLTQRDQIADGDVIATILALISILALHYRLRMAPARSPADGSRSSPRDLLSDRVFTDAVGLMS